MLHEAWSSCMRTRPERRMRAHRRTRTERKKRCISQDNGRKKKRSDTCWRLDGMRSRVPRDACVPMDGRAQNAESVTLGGQDNGRTKTEEEGVRGGEGLMGAHIRTRNRLGSGLDGPVG